MKKIAYLMLCTMIILFSCKKDKEYKTYAVIVQLEYPAGSALSAVEGVKVKATGRNTSFEATTDKEGKAVFNLPNDIYEVSSSDKRTTGLSTFNYNAVKSNVAVAEGWNSEQIVKLELEASAISQIIVKELFTGGTPTDNGSAAFKHDRYVILYNNSNTNASLANICLATAMPYNSTGSNNYYGADGSLTYLKERWMPAGQGFWYFQQDVVLKPGEQIVIALNNAVNNSVTHTKSINFNNANYYCTYDVAITSYPNTGTYKAPAELIPSSHYLKAIRYGAGNAWTLSNVSPGFFLFELKDMTPSALGANVSYNSLYGGSATLVDKKIPVSWVVDAVEAYEIGKANQKRFTGAIDAGYVNYTGDLGYSIYRNVDEAATKAIAGNTTKLVYNYSYGTTNVTGGSTDPSGIDAEASVANGARIIYKDTNNSTNDFHMRSRATLRTN
ncbi:DUF4876 domain-containing protein [Pedobacter chitinilyticus]|uniref:DUF4876 domain-containing protein n=1 Tax=Pedobacter chitinilyticus TaxID=2233776 RepID=A0A3S3R935_9SPHI|nr:DUF4876 domain-containing protein [Pedobacter chitinilyticus]RWU10757.1 DUF4876 domain-containing protein [Pedobacter chitinilyticus]